MAVTVMWKLSLSWVLIVVLVDITTSFTLIPPPIQPLHGIKQRQTSQQLLLHRRRTSNFSSSTIRSFGVPLYGRLGDDDDDDMDYDYDDDDDDYDDRPQRRRPRRRQGDTSNNNRGDSYGYDDLDYRQRQRDGMSIPSAFGQRDGWRLPESVSKALLAGVFVLGVGLGVTVDSAINTNPKDLASRDAVDQAAPNAKLCAEMGASAMAFDQRVFVSFNPFNVYVSQADVKPACVLRQANIVPILKDRKLINDKEVFSCKANMNTWAFVGDLDDQPQLSCVYKSEDAQNEFLSNPKFGIGEDYLDDDRQKATILNNNNKAKMGGSSRSDNVVGTTPSSSTSSPSSK